MVCNSCDKNIKALVSGPLYSTLFRTCASARAHNKAQRLRGDNVHMLMLDDHEDPEKICSNHEHRILTHVRWLLNIHQPVKSLSEAQSLFVILCGDLLSLQVNERAFEFTFDKALMPRYFRRIEHTPPSVEFHYRRCFTCDRNSPPKYRL
jgi:hypothetical protein